MDINHRRITPPVCRKSHGLTLIDLLIAITVLSILFGVGVPLLKNITRTNRIAESVNALASSLAYTRSEAVRRNQDVVICTSENGTGCARSGDWSQGWLVFVDSDGDKKPDTDEAILHVQEKDERFINAGYRAFGSRRYVRFYPTGRTRSNGTFTFCEPGNPDLARALILSKSGRVYLSHTRASGDPLECESGT